MTTPDQAAADTTPAPTWHDGIDRLSKSAIGVATAMFAVGLLIENIQLQTIGISDVSFAEPRYVLVGLAFVVYLALPAILLVVPIIVFRLVRGPRGKVRLLVAAVLSVASFIILFLNLPAPFYYFIERILWTNGNIARVLRFWGYLCDPTLIIRGPLLYIPLILLAATARTGWWFDRPRPRRYLLAMVGLGVFSSVIPYTYSAYPNLARAVGGGCPLIAEIDLKGGRTVRPSAYRWAERPPTSQPGELFSVKRYHVTPLKIEGRPATGPAAETLLIWHESDKFFYVSKLQRWTRGAVVIGIPKDQVDEVRYRHGVLDFSNNKLERAVVAGDFDEVAALVYDFAAMAKEIMDHAATQPSNAMTPEIQEGRRKLDELLSKER
jgi:hypothetical protein